jgi:type IV pilus assembly protein PilW
MNPCTPHPNKANQTGLSLIELMVAITLSMVIMAGLSTLFVANSSTSAEIERANRQIENGRYAMQILSEDLRLAGFLGEFDPTILPTPTTKPDPCSVTALALNTALTLHVQGYNNVASSAPLTSCAGVSDVKTGTDILVIRRASTCIAGAAGCDAVTTGIPYFQASLCPSATQLGSTNSSDYYALDWDSTKLTRQLRTCLTTNLAGLRRYRTHIYFIANNDIGSDKIPTLKRIELGTDGTGASFSTTPVPLVEGIENLQIEYGIDTAGNGAPGLYTSDPDSVPTCSGAACVTNWRNVVAVKLNLLAVNTTATPGYIDKKIYSLGSTTADAVPVGPTNDKFKRHVYQTAVLLSNPAGRKQP